jgi:thioredoxin 1
MANRRWLTAVCIVALLSAVAVFTVGCEQEETKVDPADKTTERDPGQAEPGADGKIKKVDQTSFDAEVLQADTPVLVDFYADWCGPCRALHPRLVELAEEYAGQVKVAQVNVDENGDLAQRYDVRGIPALFVIKDGKVVDQAVGLQEKSDLRVMLDRHLG